MKIVIPGDPGHARRHRSGQGRTYSPTKNKKEAKHIREHAERQVVETYAAGRPLGMVVTAYYRCPISLHRKKNPVPARLKTTAPDIDNVAKMYMDALQGLAYEDDKQIAFIQYMKVQAAQGESARTEIELKDLGEMEVE